MEDVINRSANVEKTLVGLGFSSDYFDRPTSQFSGGWRYVYRISKNSFVQARYPAFGRTN